MRITILPASPRRFSSGSYEVSNVPVLTVSIISKIKEEWTIKAGIHEVWKV